MPIYILALNCRGGVNGVVREQTFPMWDLLHPPPPPNFEKVESAYKYMLCFLAFLLVCLFVIATRATAFSPSLEKQNL